MSRVILTRYDNGQERIVVGWDHPGGGCWYQEFTLEPEDGDYPEDWEEVVRFGGYMNGWPVESFRDNVPEDMRPLITDEVLNLLAKHARDPESGRRGAIDLTNPTEGT